MKWAQLDNDQSNHIEKGGEGGAGEKEKQRLKSARGEGGTKALKHLKQRVKHPYEKKKNWEVETVT